VAKKAKNHIKQKPLSILTNLPISASFIPISLICNVFKEFVLFQKARIMAIFIPSHAIKNIFAIVLKTRLIFRKKTQNPN
jgi:Na+/citrate or Na+/malate symporter